MKTNLSKSAPSEGRQKDEAQPLVTVVIPAYNKAPYIREAVESVVNQTYRQIEIVAVDDGSSDETPEILKSLAEQYPNVEAVEQANQGVASIRNRGIESGKGKYLVFLDGDDFLYPDYLAESVRYMEDNPWCDLLHVGWNTVDKEGNYLFKMIVAEHEDFLKELLLGNLFAPHAVFCRMSFLQKVGSYKYYTVTDDWEYWIRCAKHGARWGRINKYLVGYRYNPSNNKKVSEKQKKRFFPIIDEVFHTDYGLSADYRRLESASRLRHYFFLIENYHQWDWNEQLAEQFDKAFNFLAALDSGVKIPLQHYLWGAKYLSSEQRQRFSKLLFNERKEPYAALCFLFPQLAEPLRSNIKKMKRFLWSNRLTSYSLQLWRTFQGLLQQPPLLGTWLRVSGKEPYHFDERTTILDIRQRTLDFLEKNRVVQAGRFHGYRFSPASRKTTLYSTIAALLIKHIYGVQRDSIIEEELELLCAHQNRDGLFRDPTIAGKDAEGSYHGWGWEHLTLLALMTLALYRQPAKQQLRFDGVFEDAERFRSFLNSRDWNAQAASVGNELQNIAVRLQYARDFQNSTEAQELLEIWYSVVEAQQCSESGLYGTTFSSPAQISQGIISAYHFWLIYFYDNKPIPFQERAIDTLLSNQNILGGFGPRWNSSACEDIDSIDPLVRFLGRTDYRRDDIQRSLQQALPAVLRNLNPDGGWVFRRHQPNRFVHRQMSSLFDGSDLVFTWFRTLGLAYCLTGLDEVPAGFDYAWNFDRAPGHQFALSVS